MSNVSVLSTWNISLSTEELRLVLKALGGRLKPEEIGEASLLGDILTAQRSACSITAMRQAGKVLDQLKPMEIES